MIEISPLATEKLSAYLADNKIDSPVRVTVRNGCGGPSLTLALDEPKDSDHVQESEHFTLIIDRALADSCGVVRVDFVENTSGCCGGSGFSLTSENPLPGSGDGCGGSCSTGSCGC